MFYMTVPSQHWLSESESFYLVLLQTQETSAKTYLVAVAEATFHPNLSTFNVALVHSFLSFLVTPSEENISILISASYFLDIPLLLLSSLLTPRHIITLDVYCCPPITQYSCHFLHWFRPACTLFFKPPCKCWNYGELVLIWMKQAFHDMQMTSTFCSMLAYQSSIFDTKIY